jgi:hypothetical protein
MPRDHALWPDSDAKKFYWLVRMKQHPDRQPRRAITVHGRNHDDGRDNQDFKGDGIDGGSPLLENPQITQISQKRTKTRVRKCSSTGFVPVRPH